MTLPDEPFLVHSNCCIQKKKQTIDLTNRLELEHVLAGGGGGSRQHDAHGHVGPVEARRVLVERVDERVEAFVEGGRVRLEYDVHAVLVEEELDALLERVELVVCARHLDAAYQIGQQHDEPGHARPIGVGAPQVGLHPGHLVAEYGAQVGMIDLVEAEQVRRVGQQVHAIDVHTVRIGATTASATATPTAKRHWQHAGEELLIDVAAESGQKRHVAEQRRILVEQVALVHDLGPVGVRTERELRQVNKRVDVGRRAHGGAQLCRQVGGGVVVVVRVGGPAVDEKRAVGGGGGGRRAKVVDVAARVAARDLVAVAARRQQVADEHAVDVFAARGLAADEALLDGVVRAADLVDGQVVVALVHQRVEDDGRRDRTLGPPHDVELTATDTATTGGRRRRRLAVDEMDALGLLVLDGKGLRVHKMETDGDDDQQPRRA